jgi:hypothetical protein
VNLVPLVKTDSCSRAGARLRLAQTEALPEEGSIGSIPKVGPVFTSEGLGKVGPIRDRSRPT